LPFFDFALCCFCFWGFGVGVNLMLGSMSVVVRHKWPGLPGERKGNVNATDFIFRFFDKVAPAASNVLTGQL